MISHSIPATLDWIWIEGEGEAAVDPSNTHIRLYFGPILIPFATAAAATKSQSKFIIGLHSTILRIMMVEYFLWLIFSFDTDL